MCTSRGGRAALLAVLLALAGLVLTACATPVAMPEPTPTPGAVRRCHALHTHLPDRLDGKKRRPTDPQSDLLAAWGSPPVALRCGVGPPAGLRPTSRLVTVNGVDWLPEPANAPTRFTAVGRSVFVQVIVQPDGEPAANVLVDLAGPIKETIPEPSPP